MATANEDGSPGSQKGYTEGSQLGLMVVVKASTCLSSSCTCHWEILVLQGRLCHQASSLGGTTLEGTHAMDPPCRYPYPDAPPDKILLYRPSRYHRYTCQVCMKTGWGPKSNSAAYRHGAIHCKEKGWEGEGLVVTHTGPRPIGDEQLKEKHRKNRRRLNQAAHRQEKKQRSMAHVTAGAFQVSSYLVYICPSLLQGSLSTAETCVYLTVVLRLWPVPSDA